MLHLTCRRCLSKNTRRGFAFAACDHCRPVQGFHVQRETCSETTPRFAFEEMLADRLLGNPTYNTERETQNLELLKTRQEGHRMEEHMQTVLEDVRRQMVMIRK